MGNPGLLPLSPSLSAARKPEFPLWRPRASQTLPLMEKQEAAVAAIPASAKHTSPKNDAGIDDAFNATVYSAQTQAVNLAMRFQELAGRFSENTGLQELTAQGAQMTFDFFAESKTEIRIGFQERSAAVSEGLSASQKTSYLEISREVAARFEFSGSISGAALQGFTNSAEAMAGEESLFDKFMAIANQLLEMGNAFFDEVMQLFGGFSWETQQDEQNDFLKAILNRFLEGISGMGNLLPGQSGSAGMTMQLEFKFEITISAKLTIQEQQGQVQQSDPIILDLNGNGFDLTSYRDGARFDILGNGRVAPTAFVHGGDAFLAIDRNGDGVINSGKELFGDQNGAANGFEELRKLDSNGDGVIDRHDKDYDKLLLWRDNGNGISERGELITLGEAGIAAINLNYRNVNQGAAGGNRIAQLATFQWNDGRIGAAGDAILNYLA